MTETITLHELQERFTACLFDSEMSADALPLNPALAGKDQRLNIYRNNVFHSLSTALAALYPVVKQLVGEEYFKACARSYLQDFPPRTAAMVNFGGSFPDFLQNFEPLHGYPWIADVARVELAWHESYHAEDAPPLDTDLLNQISPECLADSQIMFHPSVRLIRSPYPIYSIWHAHQGGKEPQETIELDSGGENLCIFRPEYEVKVKSLDNVLMLLLENLFEGVKLADAIDRTMETMPDVDIEMALAEFIRDGLFLEIKEDIS